MPYKRARNDEPASGPYLRLRKTLLAVNNFECEPICSVG
jgi:hypothetical protein